MDHLSHGSSVGATGASSSSAGPGRCAATARRTGKPCMAVPMVGSSFCLVHDPATAEQRRAERSKGGKVVQALKAEAYKQVKLDMHDLSSKAAIRRTIGDLLEAALNGRLPTGRVQNVCSLLALAARLTDGDRAEPPAAPPDVQITVKDFAQAMPEKSAHAARTRRWPCPAEDCTGSVSYGQRTCLTCGAALTWSSKSTGEAP